MLESGDLTKIANALQGKPMEEIWINDVNNGEINQYLICWM